MTIGTLPLLAGAVVVAIGAVVLLGWVAGSRSLTALASGLPPMKANTALALAALGAALVLLHPEATFRRRRTGRWLAGAVGVFGAVALLEYRIGNVGIDTLLFADDGSREPGRPAPLTAVAFVAFGAALATLDAHGPGRRLNAALCWAALVVVLFGIVGYVFAVDALRGASGRSGVAINTLGALVILAVGLVALRPERGLAHVLRGDDAGARMARVLLPAVSLGALVTGGAETLLHEQGVVGFNTASSSFTIVVIVGLGATVLVTAQRLRATDLARRRMEADLRRMALVVASSADAVVSIGADGRFTSWNPGAVGLLGYPPSEIIGRPVRSIVPDELLEELASQMSVVLSGRPVLGWRTRRRHRDGTLVDVEMSVSPLMDESGAVAGASAIMRDIGERKKAERRFATLLEAAPDAMIIVDDAGRLTLVNRQAERLFGYRREELIGEPVEALVPARLRERHRHHRGRFASEPLPRPMGTEIDITLQTKDGREIPVAVSLSPLHVDDGRLVIAAVRDMTERRNAERALQESEERFRRSFEDSGVGMALIATDGGELGRLLDVNDALIDITGYTAAELSTMGPLSIVHPGDVPAFGEELDRLLRGDIDVLRREVRVVASDGDVVWTAVSMSLVRDAARRPIHAVLQVQDVSERKRFEGELQHLAD
ncbi:MAG TPA: PAS domain S-box protein, partial [Baekduia sp.]|nr:PAS domain S-box protein [Baekduia sp.]